MAENDVFGPKKSNLRDQKSQKYQKIGFHLKLNFLHYIVIFKHKKLKKYGQKWCFWPILPTLPPENKNYDPKNCIHHLEITKI